MHDGALDLEAARVHGMIFRHRKQLVLILFHRRNDFHDLWIAFSNSTSGSVFSTSRGFQPAAARREHAERHVGAEMLGLVRVGRDGELRAQALGRPHHGAERSSRSGLPLISRYTLRRAASDATRSKSNGNGSRFSRMRPVGWPMTRSDGRFERAHQPVGHLRALPDSCGCGRCRSRCRARPARLRPDPSRRRGGCRIPVRKKSRSRSPS